MVDFRIADILNCTMLTGQETKKAWQKSQAPFYLHYQLTITITSESDARLPVLSVLPPPPDIVTVSDPQPSLSVDLAPRQTPFSHGSDISREQVTSSRFSEIKDEFDVPLVGLRCRCLQDGFGQTSAESFLEKVQEIDFDVQPDKASELSSRNHGFSLHAMKETSQQARGLTLVLLQ